MQALAVNDSEIDFAAGEKAVFTAEFSKNINWTLTITGRESGAVKTITGFSRTLDASNATWDIPPPSCPCSGQKHVTYHSLLKQKKKVYETSVSAEDRRPVEGLLCWKILRPAGTLDGGSFVQSGADMSFVIRTDENAVQGGSYYDMGGEVGWDWLIGLIDIPGSAYGAPTFDLATNPDNIYFNVLLSKQPDLSNALVLFQFREDDNGDGVYTDGEEDMFSLEVALNDQDGWQLISARYADLVTLVNGAPADPIEMV